MGFSVVEIMDVEIKEKYLEELFEKTPYEDISINYEITYLDAKSSTVFFAAFDNDKLIGLIDGYIKNIRKKKVGHIWDYVILSKYMEMDITNTLYTEMENYFLRNKCCAILIAFPNFDDDEIDNEIYENILYTKNGFRDFEISNLRPNSEYFEYRRMIKFL